MMGPDVGVEARSWPGKFTEQPRVDEQPEVPVDGTQARPWRSADDQSVNFLGRGVRLDAADHLEHSAARSGQPESAVPQCRLGTLGFRWARSVRCPSNSHLRDDSHFHQPRPDERHGTSAESDCQEALRSDANDAAPSVSTTQKEIYFWSGWSDPPGDIHVATRQNAH